MHFFILGILTAQFTYIVIQWLQLRYTEYLYYGTYIATFIVYLIILFRYEFTGVPYSTGSLEWMDHFKRPLAFLLYFEYFVFAENFIDIKSRFPEVHRRIQPIKKIILGFVVIQSILQINELQYTFTGNVIYYVFSLFLFFVFVTFFIKLWNTHDPLIRYLLWASLSISVGAFITNVMIIGNTFGVVADDIIFHYFFIPSCIGLFFEIYFFNTGIAYKISVAEKKLINRQQELILKLNENEKMLIHQQTIRNKLAQDLHDDLGATLSGIALHSHMIKQQIFNNKPESLFTSLELIENGAVEMVNNLNDVVWTVNPKNDNVEEMIERLKEYCYNITQAKNIVVTWKVEEQNITGLTLPMDLRRNIYLICKEAVNNSVKYSKCSQMIITGQYDETWLLFKIQDNGTGFNIKELSRGNGLKNMKARAGESNIQLCMESAPGQGTLISLQYQITR